MCTSLFPGIVDPGNRPFTVSRFKVGRPIFSSKKQKSSDWNFTFKKEEDTKF